jgi:hypothetical protein
VLQCLPDDADAFALRFLGTDAPADRGEQVACRNRVVGAPEILGADLANEARNVDVYRTAGDARGIRAEQAAIDPSCCRGAWRRSVLIRMLSNPPLSSLMQHCAWCENDNASGICARIPAIRTGSIIVSIPHGCAP